MSSDLNENIYDTIEIEDLDLWQQNKDMDFYKNL